MKHLNTQAVIISKETYPIAVACLYGGFAEFPFSRVKGAVLVINKIGGRSFTETGIHPQIVINNGWMSKKHFKQRYGKVKLNGSKFVDVEPVDYYS